MLLVTDIGNTNIVFGGLQDGSFRFRARIATDRKKSSDQYSMTIRKLMRLNGVDPEEISDCIISSVVPPVLNSVRTGLQKILNRKPMVVGPGLKTGLNIQVEDPARVGSDRIVAAVGYCTSEVWKDAALSGLLMDYVSPLLGCIAAWIGFTFMKKPARDCDDQENM